MRTATVILLGATGRLGRLLGRIWTDDRVDGHRLIRFGRPDGTGRIPQGMLRWPSDPGAEALPPGAAVVTLMGITPGSGAPMTDNVRLALEAQALAERIGAERILHVSSAAVYRPGAGPMEEGAVHVPPTPYGLAKQEMEQAIAQRVARGSPVAATVLRLANVAGADSLFRAMESGAPVVLDRFADGGGPERSYVAPRDLARLIAAWLAQPVTALPALLNVAGPRPVAMAAVLEAAGCPFDWRPAPPAALQRVALDTTLLRRIYGSLQDSAEAPALVHQWRELGDRGA